MAARGEAAGEGAALLDRDPGARRSTARGRRSRSRRGRRCAPGSWPSQPRLGSGVAGGVDRPHAVVVAGRQRGRCDRCRCASGPTVSSRPPSRRIRTRSRRGRRSRPSRRSRPGRTRPRWRSPRGARGGGVAGAYGARGARVRGRGTRRDDVTSTRIVKSHVVGRQIVGLPGRSQDVVAVHQAAALPLVGIVDGLRARPGSGNRRSGPGPLPPRPRSSGRLRSRAEPPPAAVGSEPALADHAGVRCGDVQLHRRT